MDLENKIKIGKNIAQIFNCLFNKTFIMCQYCLRTYNYINKREFRIITKCCKSLYHMSCYFKNNRLCFICKRIN